MFISEISNAISEEITVIKDGEFDAVALLGLRRDESKNHISFVLGEGYIDVAKEEDIKCLICTEEIAEAAAAKFDGGVCLSKNPKTTFFKIHEYLSKNIPKTPTRIDSSAIISDTAIIAEYDVEIGPNVVIEDNVVIKEGVSIGKNSLIMDGTVIGTPAFYYYGDNETKSMVYSSGKVRIGENVVIHSNVSIEKGVIGGDTLIDDYTCIANLVLVGHDAQIMKNCTVADNSVFAGWVVVKEDTFVGLSANIAPIVTVGKGCKLSMGAIVTKDVPDYTHVSGNFAINHDKFLDNLKKMI